MRRRRTHNAEASPYLSVDYQQTRFREPQERETPKNSRICVFPQKSGVSEVVLYFPLVLTQANGAKWRAIFIITPPTAKRIMAITIDFLSSRLSFISESQIALW